MNYDKEMGKSRLSGWGGDRKIAMDERSSLGVREVLFFQYKNLQVLRSKKAQRGQKSRVLGYSATSDDSFN